MILKFLKKFNFFENSEILGKLWNFYKIVEIVRGLTVIWNFCKIILFENFGVFEKNYFFENSEIFGKLWKFWKKIDFFEILKFFKNFETQSSWLTHGVKNLSTKYISEI